MSERQRKNNKVWCKHLRNLKKINPPMIKVVVRRTYKTFIALGKEKGFLTYREISEGLPYNVSDPEKVDEILHYFVDLGIAVYESDHAGDPSLYTGRGDEFESGEESQAFEVEIGKTSDPVRMYMREMGSVDLLTRKGEIDIAKKIENGLNQMMSTLALSHIVLERLFALYSQYQNAEIALSDLVNGFIDLDENNNEQDDTKGGFAQSLSQN